MKMNVTCKVQGAQTARRLMLRFLITLVLCAIVSFPLLAEEPYEGWQQIKTQHFQIIFEPKTYQYAQEIASFADEVYADLTTLLAHAPKELIPVVVTDRTARANGYYSPAPHRIMLFVTSPSTRFMGSRTPSWLRALLTHELTHYIHLTSPVGPARFLTPLFGPTTPAMNVPLMPGWWVEGITTYAESTYSEGGRGDAPFFELAYKAPMLEDNMWSLSQAGYQSAFPPSGRIYVAGYIFVQYLMERFGEDIYAKINSAYANLPFLGLNRAIRMETGFDARDLYADMLSKREAAFKEHLSAAQGQLFSPEALGDFHLPFATERGYIGWARTYGDGGAIVLYHTSGASPKILKLAYPTDAQSFDVTRDGRTAVVATSYEDPTHPASIPSVSVSYSDIVLVDLDTRTERWLTQGERLLHPAISPDGTKIVATQVVGPRYRLVGIDSTTGAIETLYENPEGSLYEPRFAPDGQRIIAVEVVLGRSALILLTPGDTVRYVEGPGAGGIYRPRFLDDGTILFGSDREGSLAVYQHVIESGSTTKVIEDPIGAFGAQIMDGKVVYATYSSTGYALRQLPASSLLSDPTPMQHPIATLERTISLGASPNHAEPNHTEPYVDVPRFGLWLPLPAIDTDVLAPGVWAMLSSVLGRHELLASAAWDIDHSLLLGSLDYVYLPAWGTLSISGLLNLVDGSPELPRQHMLSAILSTPLWTNRRLASAQGIDLATQLQYRFRGAGDVLISSTQLRYWVSGQGATRSFFGNQYVGILGGLHLIMDIPTNGDLALQPFVSLAAQVPVLETNHVLRLEVEALATSTGLLPATALLPRGNPLWYQQQGEAKIRGTLLYRIPLGIFDQSIPFGGILGAGATLFTQSAAYVASGDFLWEHDGYAGLEFSMDVVLGALYNFRPMAGVVFRLSDGGYKFYIDFNITWLLLNPITVDAAF